MALPHVQAAIAAKQEIVIVALGSSSTQGSGASDLSHTYPAILQQELANGLPGQHVAVLNRGIGGQDATREVARLEADAVAVHPQLVIWQAGANAALRDEDPEQFRTVIAAGVRRLKDAGIDVMLMDNQRSPRVLETGRSATMNQKMQEVADLANVGLFSRDRLMAAWEQEGEPPAAFIGPDRLHQNDRGYRCVARALARDILASLKTAATVARR